MYQQFPLDPTCDRDRSVPSYYVRLIEEAKRKISKSHKHHAKGMVSIPQKTLRSHVNSERTWIQTWQAGTNIIHIAHLLSFIQTTWIYIYIVFETEERNQVCGYYVCEHMHYFCRLTKRITQETFDVCIMLIIIFCI